ncbi:hypothetical protein [Brevundimonas aurantiaca]|jgi:hypothetical protein|uniref:hypothetical protein n=1 Tax=Brevundimonas aurantiaca TaxID=74316 RepID=UPI002FDE54C8
MGRLLGLSADHCAAGLVAAARHYKVDPLKVFGGRETPRAAMARKTVAAVVLSAETKPRGLTRAVARVLALGPNALSPYGLARDVASEALNTAADVMRRAGFDPSALEIASERSAAEWRAQTERAPRPYSVEDLPPPVRQPLERWLKAFNAGEMTLNIVKLRLTGAMVKAGLDEALSPSFPALHRAAKTLRQKAAEDRAPAPAATVQAQLTERVEAMRAAAARRVYRPVLEPDPVRMPDVRYGDRDSRPLDLGESDQKLVAACVAQGGFPRAVQIKPGVTVWADHADLPWRFRP